MKKKRAARNYDIERKNDTLKKLREGFEELKVVDPNKPVTKSALSKYTGVARETIRKYPEINDLFKEELDWNFKVDTIFGKKKIKTMNDVKRVIELYENELKTRDKKYEELVKRSTSLDMKIVQQDNEIRKLNKLLERYRKVAEDGGQ